ncbi:hypothetical protein OC846_005974 [Tilletia horrida]|uniref:Uncharacterized protein n=1 Tax=Tilletia horrida TaxID=155126 RepID=A0AAN6GKR6_9BASI|nr:hypothetical protein OC846_005974 [Tilletia horrida]
MKLLLGSVLALASSTLAITNGPYNIGASSSGFETAVLNTTIFCNVSFSGLKMRDFSVQLGVDAILPSSVDTNQPFNIAARARLVLDRRFSFFSYGFGNRAFDGNVTKFIVNAAGSSPSSTNVVKDGVIPIPRTTWVNNVTTPFEIPVSSSAITLGPFKSAQANSNIVLSFGELNMTLQSYNTTGGPSFLIYNVTCPAQSHPALLGSVAVGGSGSTTAIKPQNTGSIPIIPANSTAASTGYTYSCSFSGLGSSGVRVSFAGAKGSNAALTAGSTFSVRSVQGNIYSSAALVSLIKSKYSTATDFALTLSNLAFDATNASPATQNGIPSGGLTSSKQSLTSTAVATIPNGAPGTTFGPVSFTAGASGSPSLVSLGAASGSLKIYNGTNTLLATVTFSCPALSPAVPLLAYDGE